MKTRVSTQRHASQPKSSESLSVGMRAGPWVIEGELGRGGMGVVYAVRHAQIGKRAALKVLQRLADPDVHSVRMLQEAQVVNAIGHPNIVDIFDVGTTDDGRPYIVMELLAGHPLTDDDPTLDDCLAILAQVADALIAAHEVGVVHRDLKPDNIFLVDSDGPPRVKLLDWGIARVVDVPSEVTFEGQLVGTPRYISPEQARGECVTPKSDVYSLGVVAYELLLGRAPFDADTPADLMAMHLLLTPPPPRNLWPEIPSPIETLLHGMLAKSPDARPAMREVADSIARLRAERAVASKRKPPAVVVDEPAVRRRSRWPLVALAGLAVLAAAFALVRTADTAALRPLAPRLERAAEAPPLPLPRDAVLANCADPSVLRDGGRYYMTCTGGRGGNLYPIYESIDLAAWRHTGWIFPAGERPGWATGHFWAPELRRTRDGYAAYFSMRTTNRRHAIGVATATTVTGPYRDRGAPLVAPRDGASDAHVLADGDALYLYYKSDTRPTAIWMQPLAADGLAPRGEPVRVLAASGAWERDNVEAPAVVRDGDGYYLFYSAARYCDGNYAIGVARAASPAGPFEKLPAPLLRSDPEDTWLGPGHATVTTDAAGHRYLAYHAYRAADGVPSCSAADSQPRHVLVTPLRFEGGWPRVAPPTVSLSSH